MDVPASAAGGWGWGRLGPAHTSSSRRPSVGTMSLLPRRQGNGGDGSKRAEAVRVALGGHGHSRRCAPEAPLACLPNATRAKGQPGTDPDPPPAFPSSGGSGAVETVSWRVAHGCRCQGSDRRVQGVRQLVGWNSGNTPGSEKTETSFNDTSL